MDSVLALGEGLGLGLAGGAGAALVYHLTWAGLDSLAMLVKRRKS